MGMLAVEETEEETDELAEEVEPKFRPNAPKWA
jgi:hypothetical protein